MIRENGDNIMSVGELIEELKSFDDNTPVIIHHKGIFNVEVIEGSLIGKPCVWLRIPIDQCPE